MKYIPLETSSSLPGSTFDTSVNPSLASSTSLIFMLLIIACVAATGFVYMRGGLWRMQASARGIEKSNEEFKRGTLGLLGVLSMYLLLYALNKGILLGDVGLDGLRAVRVGGQVGQSGAVQRSVASNTSSASCQAPSVVISSLVTSNGICAGTACSTLTNCKYQQYLPIIQSEASSLGVDPDVVIVTMCKESGGNVNSKNANPNNTFDCGLMQINQNSPCPLTYDIQANIRAGVSLLKSKIAANSQVYPNISPMTGVFASYNCCANGTPPTAPSADCTQASGFPNAIPKWACPINPGEGTFNMCVVKNYACELTNCLAQLKANK
jgi:hypothetical protein